MTSPDPNVVPASTPQDSVDDLLEEAPEVSASVQDDASLSEVFHPEELKAVTNKSNRSAILTSVIMLLLAGGIVIWLAIQWQNPEVDTKNLTTVNPPPVFEKNKVEQKNEEGKDWQKQAKQVLGDFLAARTTREKMQYVIPNKGVAEDLTSYFPEGEMTDTPLASFHFHDGHKKDHERGIFLMRYRRAAQGNTGEHFPPISSLETTTEQEAIPLIEAASRLDKARPSSPLLINAFFKKTKDGLKLDSSVFIQGKFRIFKAFTEYAQPGRSKIFRVIVSETFSHAHRDDDSHRVYQISDFSYPQDFVNLPIEVNSTVASILSPLNWRGANKPVSHRTATVELMWSDTFPSRLELKEFLCWEFIGVGGELGNAKPPLKAEGKTP